MDRAQEACEATIVTLKGVIVDKQRLGDEMQNEIQSLEKALVALVETFRTANKVGRGGAFEVPPYFQTKPQLDKRSLPDFSAEADEALLTRQEVLTADFLAGKSALAARIESAFNERYSSLRTVSDLFDPVRQTAETQDTETSGAANDGQMPAKVVALRAGGAESGLGA